MLSNGYKVTYTAGEDKDCDKALIEFIEKTEIKNYGYRDYKLAFFKWVRDDKFEQYYKSNKKELTYDEIQEANRKFRMEAT